uniref:sphinganine-1-phosphate aldolase n=1 Tax=Meloidogyne javanica TaxID=6303 RepID=A0A915MYJ9_MELJA
MDLDQTPWRVVAHLVDEIRLNVNRRLDHLEQWQIVMYTLALLLFVQWVRKVLKFEEVVSFRRAWHEMLNNLPMYRKKLDEGQELTYKEFEDRIHRADRLKEFYKYLPDRGLPADDIIREATSYKTMGGILFERGHLCGSMFGIEDEDGNYQRLLKQIFELYSFTNVAFPEVFPSARKMEAECIRILCSLFHGLDKSCGVLTTSGSESIILACLAYRNSAYKKGIRKPEMIVCPNAHIAFFKAAKLLGMRAVRVRTGSRCEANVGSIKRAIGHETCMIVASAPSYLGVRFGVPVHVDATIGGFIIPFLEQCDYPAPMFDFRISGVSSINFDLHKYGYCPVGSSAVLYRDQELLQCQSYSNVDWPGGIYTSATLDGSRPGLLIALTWASLLYMGRLGYVERTQRVMDTSRMLKHRIEEEISDHLEVLGEPLGPVLAITNKNSSKIKIHALGDEMHDLGWSFTFLQNPNALRFCISLHQTRGEVIDSLISDMKKCIERIIQDDCYEYPTKTNVLFGISGAFMDRGVANLLSNALLEAYYSTPTSPHGEMGLRKRTLSIEGRKLSQIQLPSALAALREQYSFGELTSFTVPTTISTGETSTLSAAPQEDEMAKATDIVPQLPSSSETLTERTASIPLVTKEETEGEQLTVTNNINEEQCHRITVIPEEEKSNDMMNNVKQDE